MKLTRRAAASRQAGSGHSRHSLQHRGQLPALQIRAQVPALGCWQSLPGCGRTGRLFTSLWEHECVSVSNGSSRWGLGLRWRCAQLHHGVAGPRQRRGDRSHLSAPGRAQVSAPAPWRIDTPKLPKAYSLLASGRPPPTAPPLSLQGQAFLGGGGEGCRECCTPTPSGLKVIWVVSAPDSPEWMGHLDRTKMLTYRDRPEALLGAEGRTGRGIKHRIVSPLLFALSSPGDKELAHSSSPPGTSGPLLSRRRIEGLARAKEEPGLFSSQSLFLKLKSLLF